LSSHYAQSDNIIISVTQEIEAAEQFENRSISEILYSLSKFEPLSLKSYIEQPRNIDLNKHWHPLALFQLFFN